MTVFSRDRPIFLREYSTDHYNIIPYFLAKLGSEAFNSFLAVLAQAIVVYWMMGFEMGFTNFLAITYSLALTATAVAVMLGACFSDPKFATALFTVVVIPQMYFSGVFIAIDLLPNWVAWAQYLCSLTYASRLSFAYEFGNCDRGQAERSCQAALDSNNVSLDDTWWVRILALPQRHSLSTASLSLPGISVSQYWLALAGLFLFYRIAGVIILHSKANY